MNDTIISLVVAIGFFLLTIAMMVYLSWVDRTSLNLACDKLWRGRKVALLQDLERVGVVIDVFHGCQSHQNVSVGYEYGKFALDESPSSCWARVQWADGSESTLPQTELIKI